jgi:uncharacterized membrane protein
MNADERRYTQINQRLAKNILLTKKMNFIFIIISSVTGGASPQLFKSAIPATTGTIVFIPDRILFVVFLVVFFCRVEFTGLYNPGYNRFPEWFVQFQRFL